MLSEDGQVSLEGKEPISFLFFFQNNLFICLCWVSVAVRAFL